MEKIRVPKGYKYWFLDEYLQAIDTYEENSKLDDKLWGIGNYHNSEVEALEVAKLVRAVFNGAEVAEMPSEEEISQQAINIAWKRQNEYCDENGEPILCYGECYDSAKDMYEWLKSKIVK